MAATSRDITLKPPEELSTILDRRNVFEEVGAAGAALPPEPQPAEATAATVAPARKHGRALRRPRRRRAPRERRRAGRQTGERPARERSAASAAASGAEPRAARRIVLAAAATFVCVALLGSAAVSLLTGERPAPAPPQEALKGALRTAAVPTALDPNPRRAGRVRERAGSRRRALRGRHMRRAAAGKRERARRRAPAPRRAGTYSQPPLPAPALTAPPGLSLPPPRQRRRQTANSSPASPSQPLVQPSKRSVR